MTDRNKQLAQLFHEVGSIYRFLDGQNGFRAIAYENAAQSVRGLPEDILHYRDEGTLTDIPGIGKSMEQDILEFIERGRIKRVERLRKRVPVELIELMDIRGFGPKSLQLIHRKLKLKTREEVIKALQDGSIGELKGFGEKKVEAMLRGLKLHKTLESRMLLWDALEAGEQIVSWLKDIPGVGKAELAGSLRRKKETIGDIDILVACERKKRSVVLDHFTSSKVASKILAKGQTKASIILKANGRQADLRIVEEEEWGAAMQYFTGSKEHNIHLRGLARDKGFKISEYGIFTIARGKRVAGNTEESIYKTLGMMTMPPEMREGKGEIDLAIKHRIPALITLDDIRGDLQMHSNFSDGLQTLEEIAAFVQRNFRYDYIAITDHSKSSRVAGGMDEKGFLKQMKAIQNVNEKLGKDFIKAGAEVDILPDGTLDLSDELLSQLDWVTASVHSGFTHDNTQRLIRACENPYVHCIGHPTGRLIGKREPYSINFSELFLVAKETGTALEINAQPDRMDLSDELAFEARRNNIKLVISTDSHKPTDFYFMKLGVFVARRAWCIPHDILNTKSWVEIQRFKDKKKLHYV